MTTTYILTLSCPDRTGIVHAVSGFLLERGGNIEEAAQYNDHDTGLFFMRVQFACDQIDGVSLNAQWSAFAQTFDMKWDLHATTQPMRTVLMVSKEGHCLNDLLFRWKSGLLPLDIRAIVSNHREFYQLAASYNVPFHHIPVTKDNKAQAEARQYEIIQAEGAELVVQARYMQILSDDLAAKFSGFILAAHTLGRGLRLLVNRERFIEPLFRRIELARWHLKEPIHRAGKRKVGLFFSNAG